MAHTLTSMDIVVGDPDLTQILEDYQAKLATYGDAEALALFFQEAGIQAQPGQSDSCAVAKHAQATLDLPDDVQVRVGGSSIMLTRDTVVEEETTTIEAGDYGTTSVIRQERNIVASVDHSDNVEKFIDGFDHYKYPDLITPETLAMKQANAERAAEKAKLHGSAPYYSPMALDTFKKLIQDPLKYQAMEEASKASW